MRIGNITFKENTEFDVCESLLGDSIKTKTLRLCHIEKCCSTSLFKRNTWNRYQLQTLNCDKKNPKWRNLWVFRYRVYNPDDLVVYTNCASVCLFRSGGNYHARFPSMKLRPATHTHFSIPTFLFFSVYIFCGFRMPDKYTSHVVID